MVAATVSLGEGFHHTVDLLGLTGQPEAPQELPESLDQVEVGELVQLQEGVKNGDVEFIPKEEGEVEEEEKIEEKVACLALSNEFCMGMHTWHAKLTVNIFYKKGFYTRSTYIYIHTSTHTPLSQVVADGRLV